MSTIEAIRVLLPVFIGISLGKAFFVWRDPDSEFRLATLVDWTFWTGFCLVILGVSALWERMS